MGREIERKFLVRGSAWRKLAEGVLYRQGYLSTDPLRTVRIRVVGDRGFFTIKGKNQGMVRLEYEYPMAAEDANQILDKLCLKPLIEKIRYRIKLGNFVWEVDEFKGDNEGLVLAEVELVDINQTVVAPDWVSREVTGDKRYYNANLVKNPFKSWPENQ